MNKLIFLNHTSMLLKGEDGYVLTDPWLGSYAFETWKSNPPIFLNEGLFKSFLECLIAEDKLVILVSHGHDDHCDDAFIKELPNNARIVIPKFKSPGVRKRLESLGKLNISEIGEGISIGEWTFNQHIFSDHSHDDACIEVKNDSFYFLHGNDNSFAFDDITVKKIRLNSQGLKYKYYASQTNIANAYPYRYPQFESNYVDISREKIKRTIGYVIDNAERIAIDNLISYAGYTQSYILLDKDTFYPNPENVNELISEITDIRFMDFEPGDVINAGQGIIKSFYSEFLEKIARNSHYLFSDRSIDMSNDKVNVENIKDNLKDFLAKFAEFYHARLDMLDPIIEETSKLKKLTIRLQDIALESSVLLGGDHNKGIDNHLIIELNSSIFQSVIEKQINFESVYIGFIGKFYRYPVDQYNHDIIHLLNSFGYKYLNMK